MDNKELTQLWREKDGKLIHDGDCFFWDRKVCTCGLIHRLSHASKEARSSYKGDYEMDAAHQQNAMDYLLRNQPKPLEPITEEQAKANLEWLEKAFGFRTYSVGDKVEFLWRDKWLSGVVSKLDRRPNGILKYHILEDGGTGCPLSVTEEEMHPR